MSSENQNLGFVHRFIKGKEKRTLLLLHGTGGDESDLIPLAQMIDENASLLSPRGKVLENGMPRYFRRVAEGVFDVDDLKFRTFELGNFVTKASEAYEFDLDSVMALGYSNGANIGASLLLLEPQVLKGGILLRAMIPFRPENIPDLYGKKVLISAGKFDPVTPPEKVHELADLLKACKADVTLRWVNSSHSLSQQDADGAKRWLQNEFEKQ